MIRTTLHEHERADILPRVRCATLGFGCNMPSAFMGLPRTNPAIGQTRTFSIEQRGQTATPFYNQSPGSRKRTLGSMATTPGASQTGNLNPERGFTNEFDANGNPREYRGKMLHSVAQRGRRL